jgi:hypothetical protein
MKSTLFPAEDEMAMNRRSWVLAAVAFAIAAGPARAGDVVVAGDDGPWTSNGT